ncbi:hypothetical protein CEXT_718621 [Caerostris extrusa]|uniref:Uncharacterized protein n=1 Tax=Caerostris extrusa TaxID=172846 RepID=A0AAV4USJ4_CAEEX|nr:hypothetical protein CEXT_718621 [Caerostris extrusa]
MSPKVPTLRLKTKSGREGKKVKSSSVPGQSFGGPGFVPKIGIKDLGRRTPERNQWRVPLPWQRKNTGSNGYLYSRRT